MRVAAITLVLSVLVNAPIAGAHVMSSEESKTDTSTKIEDSVRRSMTHRTKTEDGSTPTTKSPSREVESATNQSVSRQEKRKLLCQNRQKAINNKVTAFSTAADKHLTRLNSLLDKVVAIKEEPALNVPNYDSLLADARAKKTNAVVSVDSLKAVATMVNCDDPTTLVKLKDVRVAAAKTREALQTYRESIKALLNAVLATTTAPSTENEVSRVTGATR